MRNVARGCWPSLPVIERMRQRSSVDLAILGRFSLIWTPAIVVGMVLVSPPLAWPGLGSNVSNWLGPPPIHSRMQALPDLRNAGALAMRWSCQVKAPAAAAAAGMNFKKSRRRKPDRRMEKSVWMWRSLDMGSVLVGE